MELVPLSTKSPTRLPTLDAVDEVRVISPNRDDARSSWKLAKWTKAYATRPAWNDTTIDIRTWFQKFVDVVGLPLLA